MNEFYSILKKYGFNNEERLCDALMAYADILRESACTDEEVAYADKVEPMYTELADYQVKKGWMRINKNFAHWLEEEE